jgi:hypothetical protein
MQQDRYIWTTTLEYQTIEAGQERATRRLRHRWERGDRKLERHALRFLFGAAEPRDVGGW